MDLHAQTDLHDSHEPTSAAANRDETQPSATQSVTDGQESVPGLPISVARARQMYQRALARWAFDVLHLKKRGIDRMRWDSPCADDMTDDDWLMAA